jgi:hypothetical protein
MLRASGGAGLRPLARIHAAADRVRLVHGRASSLAVPCVLYGRSSARHATNSERRRRHSFPYLFAPTRSAASESAPSLGIYFEIKLARFGSIVRAGEQSDRLSRRDQN